MGFGTRKVFLVSGIAVCYRHIILNATNLKWILHFKVRSDYNFSESRSHGWIAFDCCAQKTLCSSPRQSIYLNSIQFFNVVPNISKLSTDFFFKIKWMYMTNSWHSELPFEWSHFRKDCSHFSFTRISVCPIKDFGNEWTQMFPIWLSYRSKPNMSYFSHLIDWLTKHVTNHLTFDSILKVLYLSHQQSVAYSNPRNQQSFPSSETHKNLGVQFRLSAKLQLFKITDEKSRYPWEFYPNIL